MRESFFENIRVLNRDDDIKYYSGAWDEYIVLTKDNDIKHFSAENHAYLLICCMRHVSNRAYLLIRCMRISYCSMIFFALAGTPAAIALSASIVTLVISPPNIPKWQLVYLPRSNSWN